MDLRRAANVPSHHARPLCNGWWHALNLVLVATWVGLLVLPWSDTLRDVLAAGELAIVGWVAWRSGGVWALGTATMLTAAHVSAHAISQNSLVVLATLELAAILAVQRLGRQYREAHQRARLDPLTELPNRRALEEFLGAEMSRARRFQRPFTVALLDCDGFKELNDDSGHAAGDEALRNIGGLLRRELRTYDGVFRMGGDEFVIVLPETNLHGAEHVCERLRTAFLHEIERHTPGLTASLGVMCFAVPPGDVAECLALADEVMYRAKRQGRGETVFAEYEGQKSQGASPHLLTSDR